MRKSVAESAINRKIYLIARIIKFIKFNSYLAECGCAVIDIM